MLGAEPEQQTRVSQVILSKKPASEVSWESLVRVPEAPLAGIAIFSRAGRA